MQLTNGFTASSTSHLVDFDFRSATGTSLALTASTTVAGQLNAVGGATLGAATIDTLTLTNALAVLQGGTGVTSFTAGALLYGGGNGTTVAGAATGTVSSGAGISVTGGQSIIGSGLTITNLIGFPFTADSNYGALANSTSTAVWLKAGLQASSTAYLDRLNVGSSTATTLSTSTFFGNVSIVGNAIYY